MKKALMDEPKYKSFIGDRDKFLDQINHHNRLEINDVLRRTFASVVHMIESIYRRFEDAQFDVRALKQVLQLVDHTCENMFHAATDEIVKIQKKNRKEIYDFTYASEIAAIGKVLGKAPAHSKPVEKSNHQSPSGGSLEHRIGFAFDKLKRNIMTVVQRSAITQDPTAEMLKYLLKKLPRVENVRLPKRHLKPPTAFKEAASAKVTTDIVDDQTWNDIVDKFKNEYVPKYRGPEHVVGGEEFATDYDQYYGWELENELTEDFVNQVRQGQVQAAKDQGIEDFQWIAIIDDKTDECCSWRDGLTASEISAQLDGEHSDDECDATVPPAHFNCRCTMSPVTDYLPEAPESDIGEFSDWLNS